MAQTGLRPTDAELSILRVLWTSGPSTVRHVHEALSPNKQTGYTTTLKLMQIMVEKGLVLRDSSRRSHVYSAADPQAETERRLVKDLADRAFGGSAAALVMRALRSHRPSAAELDEIRRLIKDNWRRF